MSEDINLDIPIGTVVRAWRGERKLTPSELVRHAGKPVTNSYLSQLENNKIHNPGDKHKVLIAQTLDIPVSYLVNRILPEQVADGDTTGRKQLPAGQQGKSRVFTRGINPAMNISSMIAGTTGEHIESLIAAARLSEEEEERVATTLVEITRQLLALIKAQGEKQ